MNRIVRSLPVLAASFAAACGQPSGGEPAPDSTPAAIAIGGGTSLDEGLRLLDAELDSATAADAGDAAMDQHLLRAEEITDRILETRLPFDWLPDQNYSLESKLRQIQALADRIVAQIRARSPHEDVLASVHALQQDVGGLRAAIARGGTRAPPSLDSLLAGRDTISRPAPVTEPDDRIVAPPDTTTR